MAGEGRLRPLSQQLAPEEQTLSDYTAPRDELTRKSIRHQPLPEKQLPQHKALPKQPQQQFAPTETALPGQHIPEDEINQNNSTKTQPPDQKSNPAQNPPSQPDSQGRIAPEAPVLSRQPPPKTNMKPEKGKNDSANPEETNGELPNDQVIPLEELPKDQQQGFPESPAVVDDAPLLRRPRRRRNDQGGNDKYNARASLAIGIILIIIGICEIILNSLGIVFQHIYRVAPVWNIIFFLAPGFWCSIFFILCGAFGVVSARTKSTWAIVTHLVVATLASVFALILIAMCGWGIHREIVLMDQQDQQLHLPSLIVVCLMAFGAVVAVPLTVVASVICCQVFCHKQYASI